MSLFSAPVVYAAGQVATTNEGATLEEEAALSRRLSIITKRLEIAQKEAELTKLTAPPPAPQPGAVPIGRSAPAPDPDEPVYATAVYGDPKDPFADILYKGVTTAHRRGDTIGGGWTIERIAGNKVEVSRAAGKKRISKTIYLSAGLPVVGRDRFGMPAPRAPLPIPAGSAQTNPAGRAQ